jgi:hypothetical protein
MNPISGAPTNDVNNSSRQSRRPLKLNLFVNTATKSDDLEDIEVD